MVEELTCPPAGWPPRMHRSKTRQAAQQQPGAVCSVAARGARLNSSTNSCTHRSNCTSRSNCTHRSNCTQACLDHASAQVADEHLVTLLRTRRVVLEPVEDSTSSWDQLPDDACTRDQMKATQAAGPAAVNADRCSLLAARVPGAATGAALVAAVLAAGLGCRMGGRCLVPELQHTGSSSPSRTKHDYPLKKKYCPS